MDGYSFDTYIDKVSLIKNGKFIYGSLRLVDANWIFTVGKLKAVKTMFSKPKVELELTNETLNSNYNIACNFKVSKHIVPDMPIEYSYMIEITTGKFCLDTMAMSMGNANKMIQHYEAVESRNAETRHNFAEKISEYLKKYSKNKDVINLFYNFLSDSQQELFLIKEYNLVFYDSVLALNNYVGFNALNYNENLFNQAKETLKSNNNIMSVVEPYFTGKFQMFVNIISVKLNLANAQESTFLILLLLKRYCISYYSLVWQNSYGSIFSNIDNISLDDCCKLYSQIDTIQQDKPENIGRFTYYLMDKNKFSSDKSFIENYDVVMNKIKEKVACLKTVNYAMKLESQSIKKPRISIDDVDLMNGYEFESFIADMFSKMGYTTTVTKSSGDQGIDIIAERNSKKIGIQAKCYASAVSNSAIQEVVAGINFYKLDKAIVVTNNYFTNSAIELANSNNVVLWDRNILKEKIGELF